jgi:hypothetical protein
MHMHMLWRADAAVGRIDIDEKVGGLGPEVNRKPPSPGPIVAMSGATSATSRAP